MHLHIEHLAEYAYSNGLGKAAYDVVDLLKYVRELNFYCNDTSIGNTMRCNIHLAIEALNNLLQMVPCDALDLGQRVLSVAFVGKEYVDFADKLASQSLNN